ncbi:MAG: hypothetical protein C4340_00165, partial [Armatimonadota bacterium]
MVRRCTIRSTAAARFLRAAPCSNGGDFDFRAALSDERNNYRGISGVYENFVVPEGGWNINAVFVNAFFNYQSSGADFEIWSGVSAGNGGTLLFSGFGMPSTQQPTGRSWQGFEE